MDKNELGSQAEKYKREMMRLYGRSTSAPEANENSANDAADRRVQQTEADRYPDDVFDSSIAAPDNKVLRRNTSPAGTDMLQDYNDRYPEPDLSELESDYGEIPDPENIEPPAYFDEQSLGSSKGFIQVNVRTGDESGTVPNATVMVTAVVDGNRVIFAAGLTNRNGTTRKFEVPVPAPEYSLPLILTYVRTASLM